MTIEEHPIRSIDIDREMKGVPPGQLKEHFEESEDGFTASAALRRRFEIMSSSVRRRPRMRGRKKVELPSGVSPAAVYAIVNVEDSPQIPRSVETATRRLLRSPPSPGHRTGCPYPRRHILPALPFSAFCFVGSAGPRGHRQTT